MDRIALVSEIVDADLNVMLRLAIATYLLGQMMATTTEKIDGNAKELKVQAAFRYADLLLKLVNVKG